MSSIPDSITAATAWLTYLKTWVSGDASTVVKDPDGVDQDSPRKQIADIVATFNADVAAEKAGLDVKSKGPTADRPNLGSSERFLYFDDTLGKVIVWNGTAWRNVDGTAL